MADPGRPWGKDEKNHMLAELIKQQSPHPSVLYNVLMNLNGQPQLDDIPLPTGRSINSARFAFQELRRTLPHTALVSGPLGPQTPLSAPPQGLKRPFQLEPFPGREIRPKPPYPATGSAGQAPASEPTQKRKRGRPTKAAAQAKAAAEAATRPTPLIGPAPAPQFGSQSAAVPSSAVAGPVIEEPRPALPPTSRMPISAVLTPTAPKTASSSSSSSGRRRRGRSMRSEPEGLGEGAGAGHEYESPYGRATVAAEDTPARTAVMRHREEPPPIQQTPRSEPTEQREPASEPTEQREPASGPT